MIRNIFAVGMALLFVVFVMAWILGDSSGPLLNSARDSARGQLEDLIGRCDVKKNEAKAAISEAAKRIQTINDNVVNERIASKMLDRNIAAAEQEIGKAKSALAGIEDRLTTGMPIVLVSGRALEESGIRSRVTRLGNTISIANERISFLSTLRERRQSRLAKLEELRVQAPAQLGKLQQSLEFLEAKLEMYEDVKSWVKDDEEAKFAVSGIFGKAQGALEEAHLVVDKELARFEAMVDLSLDATELAPMDAEAAATGDELLAYVRGISSEVAQLQ